MVQDELNKFLDFAIQLGASDGKIIKASDIIVGDWVRIKCQYGCSGYGQCLTCPPYSPTPAMTRKILSNYQWAILLKFVPKMSDYDWSLTHKVTVKLEKELFLNGYYNAFGFASGPCPYCSECNLEQCKHPGKARPSMEASSIDVYATVRKAGFEINVIRRRDEQPKFFTVVLVC